MSTRWLGFLALVLLALPAAPARAQTFYGAGTGGFGVAPGGDRTGYGGGYGYGFGVSPGSLGPSTSYSGFGYTPLAPRTALPGWGGSYYRPSYAFTPRVPAPANRPARAFLEVRVPARAELWFDGVRTRQAGAQRLFRSPPLEAGRQYHYTVTARWRQAGRPVERTRQVNVGAGARVLLDFTRPAP